MATETKRVFAAKPAVREATPLLIGLVGPSGSGKTKSALRLAKGIQKVVGGKIFGVDTEARRMLHYADEFTFEHCPFGQPFGPLDYLAAITYCIEQGATIVIVDSTSHEHEGPGGVLEMHDKEMKRLANGDAAKEKKMSMLAWAKPKAERRRMINGVLQFPVHFIFCWRAKEKLKPGANGKEPEELGMMPIAGEEFVYEMTVNCLLLPGARGKPIWESTYPGEQLIVKIPGQFESIFNPPHQLCEADGEKMAQWAAGVKLPGVVNPAELLKRYEACSDPATLRAIEEERKAVWPTASALVKKQLKEAADACTARLKAAEEAAPPAADEPPTGDEPPEDAGGELEPVPGQPPL